MIGEVVKLKSGGPLMVVTSNDSSNGFDTVRRYWCKWFDGTELRVESFPAAGLEKVQGERAGQ